MDINQLKHDLQGLSTMAEASSERLQGLAQELAEVRERLETLQDGSPNEGDSPRQPEPRRP